MGINWSSYLQPLPLDRFPKNTPEKIEAFEISHYIRFDGDLKSLLLFSNGSTAKNRCIYSGEKLYAYFTGFFALEEIHASIAHMKTIEKEFHYYFSDALVPVGDGGGSSLFCIGTSGIYSDKIYSINYQDYDYESFDSMIRIIADDIPSFLTLLEPDR